MPVATGWSIACCRILQTQATQRVHNHHNFAWWEEHNAPAQVG